MLRRIKVVLYLGEDQVLHRRLLSVCAEENVQLRTAKSMAEVAPSLKSFDVVFAEHGFAVNLTAVKDLVVILRPEDKIKTLLGMGFTQFVFDTSSKFQILYGLYARQYVPTMSNRSIVLGMAEFDFQAHSYRYNGQAIYLSRGEEKYLEDRFIRKLKTGGAGRVHLCNLRKRFGKEFLSKHCLAQTTLPFYLQEQEQEKQPT